MAKVWPAPTIHRHDHGQMQRACFLLGPAIQCTRCLTRCPEAQNRLIHILQKASHASMVKEAILWRHNKSHRIASFPILPLSLLPLLLLCLPFLCPPPLASVRSPPRLPLLLLLPLPSQSFISQPFFSLWMGRRCLFLFVCRRSRAPVKYAVHTMHGLSHPPLALVTHTRVRLAPSRGTRLLCAHPPVLEAPQSNHQSNSQWNPRCNPQPNPQCYPHPHPQLTVILGVILRLILSLNFKEHICLGPNALLRPEAQDRPALSLQFLQCRTCTVTMIPEAGDDKLSLTTMRRAVGTTTQ